VDSAVSSMREAIAERKGLSADVAAEQDILQENVVRYAPYKTDGPADSPTDRRRIERLGFG